MTGPDRQVTLSADAVDALYEVYWLWWETVTTNDQPTDPYGEAILILREDSASMDAACASAEVYEPEIRRVLSRPPLPGPKQRRGPRS